jgi:hypothetical protein
LKSSKINIWEKKEDENIKMRKYSLFISSGAGLVCKQIRRDPVHDSETRAATRKGKNSHICTTLTGVHVAHPYF